MLTAEEEKYLTTIPETKLASVVSFNNKVKGVSNGLIESVHAIFPDAEILFMGASALGIAGQNDIDLYLLALPTDFAKYQAGIIGLFGQPSHIANSFVEWDFIKESFDVEFYISDPTTSSMQRQIRVFDILKSNPKLCKEYEEIKLAYNGKSFRDYQRAKYQFYNRILISMDESNTVKEIKRYLEEGYLFHGSPNPNIEKLEPRFAIDVNPDRDFNNDTAVFGSNNPAASIIFSLLNLPLGVDPELRARRSSVRMTGRGPLAAISTDWEPYIRSAKGTLYILPSQEFIKEEGWQAKSHSEVIPVARVTVTLEDYEKLGGKVLWYPGKDYPDNLN